MGKKTDPSVDAVLGAINELQVVEKATRTGSGGEQKSPAELLDVRTPDGFVRVMVLHGILAGDFSVAPSFIGKCMKAAFPKLQSADSRSWSKHMHRVRGVKARLIADIKRVGGETAEGALIFDETHRLYETAVQTCDGIKLKYPDGMIRYADKVSGFAALEGDDEDDDVDDSSTG